MTRTPTQAEVETAARALAPHSFEYLEHCARLKRGGLGPGSGEREAIAGVATARKEAFAALIAAEAVRLAEAPQTAWQPIKTAPRDGTEIILGDHGTTYAGFWSTAECRRQPSNPDGNWFEECDRGNEVGSRPSHPTHWMPLPAAPSVIRKLPIGDDGGRDG